MASFQFLAATCRGLLAIAWVAGAPRVCAQPSPGVRGTVQDPSANPVEYATVTLHRAADSTVVKTEFSTEKGTFRFEQAPAGRYLVSAAQVGFGRQWSQPFDLSAQVVDLPALTLATSAATQLKEVQVVGQKPLYERLADRTVVNVEGSTLAAGNTSLEVLARAPGVTVDNDNVALRGRQGVLVLIDGRRQPMTGTELADYLRALPADQLKSIELITNPPAKYDAQGGAGVIAINLQKDQRQGTNGNLSLSYGRSQYNRYTSSLTLNHRHKKVNLYGAYTYAERSSLSELTIHRDFYAAGSGGASRRLTGTTDQANRLPNQLRSHTARVGLDYSLSEHTTLGAAVSGLGSRNTADGTNQSVLRDVVRGGAQTYNSTNYRNGRSPNAAGNLNFRRVVNDSAGTRELTADADYARYRSTRDQRLQTYGLPGPGPLTDLTQSDQRSELVIQSAKVDYSRSLSRQLRVEGGAKTSLVTADNDLVFFVNNALDLGRSNRFRYDENINAAYANVTYKRPKLTLQAGLRGEQTNAVGKQDREVEFRDFTRHYFQLFPSAALQHQFSDKHETSFSLSRRIDRPSYGQLNPFREIIDKTTSGSGNPELRPETSYNLEVGHTYRQKYSVELSYSRTSTPLVGVVQPETDSTVLSTTRNLDRQHYVALTLTAPVEVAKWWKSYNNAVVYYNRFAGNLAGTNLNRGGATLNLSSNHTFTFGSGWSAELNGRYRSREVYGFLVQRSSGELSAGVQKSLWERKANLKLSAADLFFTATGRVTSTYDNYVERFFVRRDTRVATLTFTYLFGNDKVAPTRRRQGGAEDEKRRAG